MNENKDFESLRNIIQTANSNDQNLEEIELCMKVLQDYINKSGIFDWIIKICCQLD